jgi:NAD(P)-dependent dehydrogenase (short-subunit alcohol dehydrogenase family)
VAFQYRSLEGRLVLITGGSSGIGLALARMLAGEGARVWLLARHQAKLDAALKSLPSAKGQQHGMLTADVTS